MNEYKPVNNLYIHINLTHTYTYKYSHIHINFHAYDISVYSLRKEPGIEIDEGTWFAVFFYEETFC